jgi:hypothetical protein
MRRVQVGLGEALLERVDSARGSVPRERFLRELIEAALDDDGYVEEPPQKDWRAKAAEVYEGFSAQERPTVTPQPFLQTDLVAGQVSLAPSRAEPPKVVKVATRPAAASLPFSKNCAKTAFHFEGKVCRFCGGDH